MITEKEFTPDKRHKFVSNVKVVFGDCWEWTGTKRTNGYGSFYAKNMQTQAHRVMYAWVVGPISGDRIVHHTCDNKGCVNPDHLALMSHSAHTSIHHGETHNKYKPHCFKGHLFSDENTIIVYREDGSFRQRKCRKCINAAQRKRRACTEGESRSIQRRKATQKGEPVPEFDKKGEDEVRFTCGCMGPKSDIRCRYHSACNQEKSPCPDCGGSKRVQFTNLAGDNMDVNCSTCKDGTGREG